MNGPSDPTRFVHDKCAELGFALCGVCEAQPTKWPRELWQWLEDGKHGEMDYLANHTAQRIDPGKMMPGIRSIICVADRYHDGSEDNAAHHEKGKGRIARYARGDDYHVVMKKRLHQLCDALIEAFPEETFRAFVDTAPVLEREHSTRAGLGAIGKHTLLIETGVGSYLLLGEVITTLRLEPEDSKQTIDPCGTCTRCIDACPTDAITPYSIDATKCISYLTIEHRGLIDETLHEPMGDWIFGCDICQEVCPHNQPTHRTSEAPVHEAYSPRKTWKEGFDLVTILNWTEDDRREAFIKSSMKRAKLDM
ncbi:MAG: tRNA epoxyqueuosine(34) reductase QueG, partial [Planctomycetota bacterium]|nr:tRNA epoxyqueuosine(34) reductase QueG [Planctomycetota bacterium]